MCFTLVNRAGCLRDDEKDSGSLFVELPGIPAFPQAAPPMKLIEARCGLHQAIKVGRNLRAGSDRELIGKVLSSYCVCTLQ